MSAGQYRIPKTTCPACGFEAEHSVAADSAEFRAPEAGGVAVCWGCAAVLVFRADLSLEAASTDWMRELAETSLSDYMRLLVVKARIKTRLMRH